MSNEKSLKTNTILNIIKTCSAILFPLITFPYISRVLLPENVGKVNFAQSYVNYFSLIAGLGLSTHAMRECATSRYDQSKLEKVSSELFSINLITTFIAYIFLFISLILFKNLQRYEYLIFIESIIIISTTMGADWLNSAMEDYKYITLRTVAFQIISLILMFMFVKKASDYYIYALISVISSAGANIVNIFYRKKYCKVHFTFHIDWKKHLSPILFLFVMQLSVTIFNNADTTMLGIMKNDYQVGLYSTALKATRIISQVVQSLSLVIIPRLTILFAREDFKGANILLRKVLGFNLTLGLPCVVGTILMANEIIYIIGGTEYLGAVPVIRILILSFAFSLIGGSFLGNAILIPMKQEKYYMIVCCITAVANVIMNALLIPGLGAVGASFATAMNGFIIMVLLFFKIDKRIKIPNIKPLIKGPIYGCIGITIICFLCDGISSFVIRTILSITLSIIVYFAIEILAKNDMIIEMINTVSLKVAKKELIGGKE